MTCLAELGHTFWYRSIKDKNLREAYTSEEIALIIIIPIKE